ncbi:MAG: hypothetical protein H6565_03375, partial [Lewinellaceae bacterium]|nr:hypothetical protein [Lewinellaceae bacterium]
SSNSIVPDGQTRGSAAPMPPSGTSTSVVPGVQMTSPKPADGQKKDDAARQKKQ